MSAFCGAGLPLKSSSIPISLADEHRTQSSCLEEPAFEGPLLWATHVQTGLRNPIRAKLPPQLFSPRLASSQTINNDFGNESEGDPLGHQHTMVVVGKHFTCLLIVV